MYSLPLVIETDDTMKFMPAISGRVPIRAKCMSFMSLDDLKDLPHERSERPFGRARGQGQGRRRRYFCVRPTSRALSKQTLSK